MNGNGRILNEKHTKKAAAAILSAAVALSSAAYAEQAVYDKATNTVTVDASGYSTVSIVPENADVSDKDNIIYIKSDRNGFRSAGKLCFAG